MTAVQQSARTALRREVTDFLFRPEARRAAQSFYARLVTEAPVLDLDGSGRMWIVSGYDEIVALSTSSAASGDFAGIGMDVHRGFSMADVLVRMLPMRSGPDHARLRRLVSTAFSARAAERLRESVRAEIDALLTPARAAGRLEVFADLAVPLPVAISCAMLDVPVADRPQVATWAGLISAALYLPEASDEARAGLDVELPRLRRYIDDLCRERAARPGADLVSLLAVANAEGRLDDEDLFAFVVMLFVNGLDTLTSGLTVAAWHLLQRPDASERIRTDAAFAAAFFDEATRFDAPVRGGGRAIVADVRIGDEVLAKGSAALMLFAAANRDPRHWSDPDVFDPGRTDRRHLGFGHGPHRCIGSPLSLLAGSEVLQALARLDGLRGELAAGAEQWDTSLVFAGLRHLPVSFTPHTGSWPLDSATRRGEHCSGAKTPARTGEEQS